jgi:ATP-dependent Clp protease protease subunit
MNPNEFNKYAVKHHGISSATLHNFTSHMNRNVTNLTPYINGRFFAFDDGSYHFSW